MFTYQRTFQGVAVDGRLRAMTRKRDAAATRAAILEAARTAFSSHSFDQVGIREITQAAGVNGSLVSRYFGSKQRLFAEVMRSDTGFVDIEGRSFEEAIGILADRALDRPFDRPAADLVFAFIRSAPIDDAQPILRDYLTRQAIDPLARLIGGHHADEKASLVIAILLGVIFMRAIVKCDPLASTTGNSLATLIEGAIRCVVDSASSESSLTDA